MHQEEEMEANQAYEDPKDDKLIEEERFWTLFEDEEDEREMGELDSE